MLQAQYRSDQLYLRVTRTVEGPDIAIPYLNRSRLVVVVWGRIVGASLVRDSLLEMHKCACCCSRAAPASSQAGSAPSTIRIDTSAPGYRVQGRLYLDPPSIQTFQKSF